MGSTVISHIRGKFYRDRSIMPAIRTYQNVDVLGRKNTKVIDMRSSRRVSSSSSSTNESSISLGYSQTGTSCTVYSGFIVIHGVGRYTVPQTTVTLSGGPLVYVYVKHTYDHATTQVTLSNSIPLSNVTEWQFVIATFAASGTSYSLSIRNHNGGDINLGAPLA